MNILYISPEIAPFAKTGGLADVLAALPRAVARRGHRVALAMPLYRCVRQGGFDLQTTDNSIQVPLGQRWQPGRWLRGTLPGTDIPVYFLEHAEFYERDDPASGAGLYQYRLPQGKMADYADNSSRFIFFCRAVLEGLSGFDFWPDILHLNDWQTGLIPVYVKKIYAPRWSSKPPKTLLTIHNLAYKGLFWHWDMPLTGLDWSLFNWRELEFYGKISFLKAGIVFADLLTTVSRRYALEIQTPEYGCGLEGVLREHRGKLVGILNGVDYSVWDPRHDPYLPCHYDVATVTAGKAECRRVLHQRWNWPCRERTPLVVMVSRLVEQKGLDLIQQAADEILRWDLQWVILGLGEPHYHQFLRQMQNRHPQKLRAALEFNEPLAHLLEAAGDIFLMPSRFEPSGLNQLYSLRYGTVPVVRRVGGLADTITDCTPETLAAGTANGFCFEEYTAHALLEALRRAIWTFRDHPDIWRQLQRTGMMQDFSWDRSAAEYEAAYRRLLAGNNDESGGRNCESSGH
ncbi:Glycogen synthase [bacterium HR36]|nr:Glycogen synthase [bacterium HR36]